MSFSGSFLVGVVGDELSQGERAEKLGFQSPAADLLDQKRVDEGEFVIDGLHNEQFIVHQRVLILIHRGHAFLIGTEV